MRLKSLKIIGFKSFAKSTTLEFPRAISAIVGPNGSGKSNVAEAIAWVLGEQSIKNLRGKKGEDLIFNGSSSAAKMGKASAALVFDGPKGETAVSRIVYRDGLNEYFVNNKKTRLKDVAEFLNKECSGSLKHHIIRQGESDAVLNASLKERRQIIEEALGLMIFKAKKEEGERKLARTEENINQAESLRNEIQPHLRFLKKQAEKIEKLAELKNDFEAVCSSYFSKARAKFSKETEQIETEKKKNTEEQSVVEKKIKGVVAQLENFSRQRAESAGLRKKISEIEREVGRHEGILSQSKIVKERTIAPDMDGFIDFLKKEIERALAEENLEKIKSMLGGIKNRLAFLFFAPAEEKEDKGGRAELEFSHRKLLEDLKKAKEEESVFFKEFERSRILESDLRRAEIQLNDIKNQFRFLDIRKKELVEKENVLRLDIKEAEAILGQKIPVKNADKFDETELEEERRRLERLKIKIEEGGGAGEEILKEYKEVSARDEFLFSEISDLKKTADSLRGLIEQLVEKLDSDFKSGVLKINDEFQKFFELMFGGGKAELKIKDDGADVAVSLPKKRIFSLNMLSGGERALTSIAFLFAVSQVKPPPFLVLDETDAALDESNSRKYADLLKKLSEQTQLILITHNRATMSAAGILYGVTMAKDGISRLLSVKLDEAKELAPQ
ncbi:AAA family ATPase [Patescibacteria group bacterium]|nr:AAA family ATPase [Patescibacteria group bacterium]